VIEELNTPWSAVGQINVSGYRRIAWCTGSLIATNVVITAAHCVMNPSNGKPYPLNQLHFLAGVKGSSWLTHSTAKCLHFPDEYKYIGPTKLLPTQPFQKVPRRAFVRDVALLVLKDEVNSIPSLELDTASIQNVGVMLVHASYPADRRYRLTAHFKCRLLARDQDLWITDCDTSAASSGGPVFVERNGTLKLAAIMVGVAGTSGSVAVPIAPWIDRVAKRDCP
jgi:protease YdgD